MANQAYAVENEPRWFRYGRAVLGGVALSAILIGLGLLYTVGEGGTSRELWVNQLFINAIMVVGLSIFVGNTGIMSFGHLGFATLAGYIVALLIIPVERKVRQIPNAPFGIVDLSFSPWMATLIAVTLVTLFAFLLSFVLTRSGQGIFAATIITLALLEIIHEATLSWGALTAGGVGLGFIPKLTDRTPIIITLIISIMVARVFAETAFGRWAKAAREDDIAANVLGISASIPRTIALLLSVVIVSFGASLKVQDIGSMTPRLMFFEPTLLILSMLIVGGRRSLTGALVGVVVIAIGNEFSRVTGDAWSDIPVINLIFRPTLSQLFLGGVMLFTMLYRPDGLIKDWELDHLLRDWWRRKERKPNQLASAPDLRDRPVRTLYVEHLTVDFGGFRALNDVSLQVSSHEIVGLIGPNGAGKTTLLNAVTGFAPVTSGQVRIDNRIVSGKSPHQLARAGLARTFQNLRLFKDLSVQENVAVSALAAERLQDQAVDPQITRLLVEGNLWEQRYYRANELDYGNQRRLELARAAARIPDFLLLDEPTSGMSDEESARMIEHIRHMATSIGAGVLVIDHDLHFITNLCDRIYVLDYGTLIAHGAPHIIKTDERVRSAYLGG